MREILFRGKRLDNGEWVYGYYAAFGGNNNLHHVIYTGKFLALPVGEGFTPEVYYVDPETVGQFTGLTDKNGKKIFEGDILSEKGSLFLVVYDKPWAKFKLQYIGRCIQYPEWNRGVQMEIVGNIHDNPELLEG